MNLKAKCLQKPEKESQLNIHNYKVKTHASQGGSHSCTMKYLAMYSYSALDGMLVHRRDMVSAVFHWYPLKDLASVVQQVENAIPGLKIHSGLLLVMSTVGRNFRTVTSLYWLVKILKIIWWYLEPSRQTSKNTILKKRCLSSWNIIVWKCFFFSGLIFMCWIKMTGKLKVCQDKRLSWPDNVHYFEP